MLNKKYIEFLNRFVEYKINESCNDIRRCSSISKNMYIHQSQMPDYFSVSIRLLSILLNYMIFFIFGMKFSNSNPDDAIKIINYLRSFKRFNFVNNIIKFHDSLLIMAQTECDLIEEDRFVNYKNNPLHIKKNYL